MASCARGGQPFRLPASTARAARGAGAHRAQAELGARAEHAYRNLAPVGAEDLLEGRLPAARARREPEHVMRARDSKCECSKPAGGPGASGPGRAAPTWSLDSICAQGKRSVSRPGMPERAKRARAGIARRSGHASPGRAAAAAARRRRTTIPMSLTMTGVPAAACCTPSCCAHMAGAHRRPTARRGRRHARGLSGAHGLAGRRALPALGA
jgi:hypothetical protein